MLNSTEVWSSMGASRTPSLLSTSARRPSLASLPEYGPSSYTSYPRPDHLRSGGIEMMIAATLATCRVSAQKARDLTGNKSYLLTLKAAKEQRKQILNQKLAPLSKDETKNKHRSLVENLYVDLLQNGYFKTFQEIFHLVKKQEDERLKGGPDSVLWHCIPLARQPAKLDMMSRFLKQAEDASRLEDFGEVYSCHFTLAKFFQAPEDRWLSEQFFKNCLGYSKFVQGDEGQKTAEALCAVGLSAERRGKLPKALENLYTYYHLTDGQVTWLTNNGKVMHYDACCQLTRIYSKMAQNLQKEENMTACQEHLAKAFQFATESEDKTLINEITYHLGLVCHKTGDPEAAHKHLRNYLDSCLQGDDKEGLAKAYDAIAIYYQSEGKTDEAIVAFQEYTKLAEETNDDKALAKASLHLGAIHNCIGNYLQSAGYSIKAFSVSQSEGSDRILVNASRVQYGISVGHRMLSRFTRHFDQDVLPYWERLLDWKEYKKNDFDKPLPLRASGVRREVRRIQLYRLEKEEKLKEKKSLGGASTKKPRRASVYIRKVSEQSNI